MLNTDNNIETSIFAEINRLRAENERLRELIKSYTQDHVRLLNELLRDSAAKFALGETK